MPEHPPLGARVVLRYRRPAGSVPSQSDVLGILESLAPSVAVREADGALTTVAMADVVVLKAIAAKPVRTGEIRKLEHAAALADPALECEWVAGWVARASSFAVPLADPSMPEGGYFHDLLGEPTIRALAAWYAARGQPLQLRLPDRLVRPPASWLGFDERLMLAAEVPAGEGGPVADGDSVLLSTAPDDVLWAGLALGGSPSGIGPRLAALLAAASERGATRAYLEVHAAAAGGELETAARRLGFGDHHRVRHVRLELS